jgi:hypothetical protein
MEINPNAQPYDIFIDICKGVISPDDFVSYMESFKSGSRLAACETRFDNATKMSLSYMNEFAERGLVYVPKNTDPEVKKRMLELIAKELKQC